MTLNLSSCSSKKTNLRIHPSWSLLRPFWSLSQSKSPQRSYRNESSSACWLAYPFYRPVTNRTCNKNLYLANSMLLPVFVRQTPLQPLSSGISTEQPFSTGAKSAKKQLISGAVAPGITKRLLTLPAWPPVTRALLHWYVLSVDNSSHFIIRFIVENINNIFLR